MNRSRRVNALLGAVLIAVGTACSAPTDTAAGDETIRIGVVVSVTGSASSLGEPERNTVQLFEQEFSEVGGAEIEWIVEDDASDPTQAVTAVKQMIDRENVHAVVCCTVSPNSLAIIETVHGDEVPNISLAAAAQIVEPASEREWVFKTPQNDALMIDVLTDHMLEQGIENVAFLGFDDAYGEGGLAAFEQVIAEKPIEMTGRETFSREDTDVTAQLTQLSRDNPDAYLIWAIPPGADVAQKNLVDLGLDGVVYQSHGVANATFLELGGNAIEGTYLPAGKLLTVDDLPDSDAQKEVLLAYRDSYEEEHGEGSANTFGGHAYDAMLVLEGAIERALDGDADPSDVEAFRSALRDEIEATSDLAGTGGVFSYSADDHAGLDTDAVVMLEVSGGDWSLLE
ncbi:MAG: ABC transporter substrate-binding protein [Actinobacteria bacterium]|nr:ABC transporter substrate-binding protein [Actinomycetota bacterium]